MSTTFRPATLLESKAIARLKQAEEAAPNAEVRRRLRKQRGYIHGRCKTPAEINELLATLPAAN